MADAPRVFLSYSQESDEHSARVLALADALYKNGIRATLDRYVHPAPEEGWPLWMDRNLDGATFVLMICTETYRRRVMGLQEPGKGLGVTWEGSLIYNLLYHKKTGGSRLIPILFPGSEPEHIPNPVQGHSYYRIAAFDLTDRGFEALLRHLTDQPATPPPELGPLPTLPPNPRPSPGLMVKEEVLKYLDALADSAARLPAYFPAHLRRADAGRIPFDAIRQMVQVVADRSAWDRWRAEERERARAAGLEVDRLAYAPSRPRPEDRQGPGERDPGPAPAPPIPWDEHAAARFPRAVILGDPGFGKTWLLRYEARRLAREAARLLREENSGLDALTLPLLARLSDLNRTDGPLEEALVSGRSEAFRLFALQRIETGNAVVLLDAWDEVPVEVPEPGQPIANKPHHRQQLGERLDAFARRFPRCRVLLTSRIVGYAGSPIADARELELFAFDGPQIESFAHAWFGDAAAAGPFLAFLTQNPQVRGLARIPLMLTLICRAWMETQGPSAGVPVDALTRRASIYRLCLHGLLRDWKGEKEGRRIGECEAEPILEILAPAVYALFAEGHEQFGEGLLREKVRAALRGLGDGHELARRDASTVIAELKHAGILVTTGEHRDAPLLFLHRTFHEYLAALALARRARAEGWEAIASLVNCKAWRPAWQEVIVLLAGQLADPLPLLRLLADKRRDDMFRHRLALAALCLTEIAPDVLRSPVVDEIATEVIALSVEYRMRWTEPAIAHLTQALPSLRPSIGPAPDSARWGQKLLALTRDDDADVRRAAGGALGGLGAAATAPALDRLLELTRDSNFFVRSAAARALGGLGAAAAPALPRLLAITRDGAPSVRATATEALRGLAAAAAPALPRLLEMTRDDDLFVRVTAARALKNLGAAAAPALPRLLAMTRDHDAGVREAAAEALGNLGAAAAPALGRLLEMTRHDDAIVRRTGAEALNRIMTEGIRIFEVTGWKRFFRPYRFARLDELDPAQPSTS